MSTHKTPLGNTPEETSDNLDIAGVPLPTSKPRSNVNTLTVSLVAIIAVLVVALVVALIRPWDQGIASQAQTSSDTHTPDVTTQTAHLDSYQQAEADLAAAQKLTAGTDYIPSQASAARTAIAQLPQAADGSGLTLGPADAPVHVRVFADFSCPICVKLHKDTFTQLEARARAGDIRLEFTNFVIFDEKYGSGKAARGALAAAQQGRMWEFIAAAFNSAHEGEHPTYTDESVAAIASQAGVPDMAAWSEAYASTDVAHEVSAQTSIATGLGLGGTPAMLIGNAFVGGYVNYQAIDGTITMQKKLNEKGLN